MGTNLLKRVFYTPPPPPAAGLYHYQLSINGGKSRVHLRIEADGYGLLIINANHIFHLNPTAAYAAYLHSQHLPASHIANAIRRYYQVSAQQARQHLDAFLPQLESILDPNGPCPVCDLNLETLAPFSANPSAPYRMDLAITYRCNNNCAHCYNARPRNGEELSTAEWKKILDRLWDLSIPHIVFTGGEPTLRPDLPELIAHAEQLGQITGINTNGRMLKQPAYVQKLVEAGLDHVQITLESHNPAIHDHMVAAPGAWEDTIKGIQNALSHRLFVMTNTTLLQENSRYLAETLHFLADLGVPTVGLNALIYAGQGASVGTGLPESQLPPLLNLARRITEENHQKLIWYTPTQYCHFDPIQMELGVKGCTAALYNMCIEPDGSVIPCQSYYQSLGKLLDQDWESIWNHELARTLRQRSNLPVDCQLCAYAKECGGGCPLARQNATYPVPIPIHPHFAK